MDRSGKHFLALDGFLNFFGAFQRCVCCGLISLSMAVVEPNIWGLV